MSIIWLSMIASLILDVILIFNMYVVLSNIIYMLVIFESISAGLIISLINKYLLTTKALEECARTTR